MGRQLSVVTAGLILLLTGGPVLAHHASAAEFDGNKPVTLEGAITRVEWVNPHAWIHIEVKSPDGTVVEWKIEGGSPNVLLRRGFTKASLQPGTMILVEGFLAKDGTAKANGRQVTLADGKKLFFNEPLK